MARIFLIAAAVGLLSAASTVGMVWSQAPAAEPVVRITAKRFEFEPNEVVLTRGVPVVIELVSLDRMHGFRIPQLDVRADVLAEGVTRLRIVPERAGRFGFLCDVFCGVDHEEMEGAIIVREP